MGVFDRFYIPCPGCGKPQEFQTKYYPDAHLRQLPAETIATGVAAEQLFDSDNSEYGPERCNDCGTTYRLVSDPPLPATVALRLEVAD